MSSQGRTRMETSEKQDNSATSQAWCIHYFSLRRPVKTWASLIRTFQGWGHSRHLAICYHLDQPLPNPERIRDPAHARPGHHPHQPPHLCQCLQQQRTGRSFRSGLRRDMHPQHSINAVTRNSPSSLTFLPSDSMSTPPRHQWPSTPHAHLHPHILAEAGKGGT